MNVKLPMTVPVQQLVVTLLVATVVCATPDTMEMEKHVQTLMNAVM